MSMQNQKIRRYSELILLPTFEERFEYLKLNSAIGVSTFGWARYLGQAFYHSDVWLAARNRVIVRDSARDLGIPGREIKGIIDQKSKIEKFDGLIHIHHMNPALVEEMINNWDVLLDPEYLITTLGSTHRKIHYGELDNSDIFCERKPNDTCPWR